MKYLKKEKLREINNELKNLIQRHEAFYKDLNVSISILGLFRLKDEVENLEEYPFSYTILRSFILFALLPVLTNALSVVVSQEITLR
jgi:SpoVK/Ycf46/Vps4 family AAA+-type ATPase